MSLLQIHNLRMQFGGLSALAGVDLEVEEGQIFGVIGPNGAGKTTLFNVITGVYTPTGGQMIFRGVDITHMEPHEIARQGVARTFQHSRLMMDLSVLDNLLLGFYGRRNPSLVNLFFRPRKVQGQIQEFTDRAAELVSVFSPSLTDRFFERIGDLPFLDRRRIEICRALAASPRLLLLDEPTAGMSPEETQQLMQDVRKVRDSVPGMTVVIIEHDMNVIAGVSEQVACLNYGEKIAEGTFEEVASHPKVRAAYLGGEVVA